MNFNSLLFLIYLPIVLLVYWLLPQKAKWAFLLVASYFFYAFQNYWLILLILSTTLVSYLCSLGISKTEKTWAKRFLLGVALTFMLGMLFVFKYLDFAVSSVVPFSSFWSKDGVPSLPFDSSCGYFLLYLPNPQLRHRCL